MPAASGGFTPRLSTMAAESRAQGSFGSAFAPSPPQREAVRPVSAGTPRAANIMNSSTGLNAKQTVRPASARPSMTAPRPWSGKGKKKDAARGGKAELAKREKLPDSHPDKIFVPPPPELEAQWVLSAVDTPLLESLVTRYSGFERPRSRHHVRAACRWDEESQSNTLYLVDSAMAKEKSMHIFHLEENRWQLLEVSGQLPVLGDCSVTIASEKIIVLGGQPAVQPGRRHMQAVPRPSAGGWVHIFDTLTGIWTQQHVDAAWTRVGHSATLVGRQIYIYGGDFALEAEKQNDAARMQPDLVLLNAASMCITEPEIQGELPPRRSHHSGALHEELRQGWRSMCSRLVA